MRNLSLVSDYTYQLALQAYTYVRNNCTLLTLGGDHSLAIGSVAGVAKAIREATGVALGVVWVDAHADINTPESSLSGNVHGMPVAFLTGIAPGAERKPGDGRTSKTPFDWLEDTHRVDMSKLVYIGLRDFDEAEKKILQQCGAKMFGMAEIKNRGIASIISRALEYLGPDTPLHLSFDIDALDPTIAPSTGTPVSRGLSLWEGRYIASELAKTERLVAMDLVEVNPLESVDGDGPKKTVTAACQIIEAALGERSHVSS
ncbi:MAG: hypothetical protein LQ339_007121 [Xanthoria mediterranea]|nr:MAG: hypothetical protein LQ339_007121 [Xanthoria mediterranea]